MERYTIDPQRSRVWIDAKSSLHPIHSESGGLEGFFEAEVLGGGRINPRIMPHAHLELPLRLPARLVPRKRSQDNPRWQTRLASRFPVLNSEV